MTAQIVKAPERIQAKCEACGHNWKMERGEAFLCPYCHNMPKEVTFFGSYAVLSDEVSQRWWA